MNDLFGLTKHALFSLRKTFIILILSFIAISETSIKELINTWVDQCKVIISIEDPESENIDQSNLLKVYLHVLGTMQQDVGLVFRSSENPIKRISFEQKLKKGNLLLHPMAHSQDFCAVEPTPLPNVERAIYKGEGLLCQSLPTAVIKRAAMDFEVTTYIEEISSSYSYNFEVDFMNTVSGVEQLQVFIRPLNIDEKVRIASDKIELLNSKGIKTEADSANAMMKTIFGDQIMCNVEEASIFNIFYRVDALYKFLLLALILIVLTFLLSLSKHKKDESSGDDE